MFQEDKNLCA